MANGYYTETPHSDRHGTEYTPHVENSERIEVIRAALAASGLLGDELEELQPDNRFSSIQWRSEGVFDELEIVHSRRYLQKLARSCLYAAKDRDQYLDNDTYITRSTLDVVADSVAVVRTATEHVLEDGAPAFCAIRPPGHHATRQSYGGFCVVNFAAYAAQLARNKGAEKVAVIDWDAHFGNGTRNIFKDDDDVFYLSLHGGGLFPRSSLQKSGARAERIIGLASQTGDQEYLERFVSSISSVQTQMDPRTVVISAGFDGHKDDPLSDMNLSSGLYGELTEVITDPWPNVPVISILEGGYDHRALAESVVHHVGKLVK